MYNIFFSPPFFFYFNTYIITCYVLRSKCVYVFACVRYVFKLTMFCFFFSCLTIDPYRLTAVGKNAVSLLLIYILPVKTAR